MADCGLIGGRRQPRQAAAGLARVSIPPDECSQASDFGTQISGVANSVVRACDAGEWGPLDGSALSSHFRLGDQFGVAQVWATVTQLRGWHTDGPKTHFSAPSIIGGEVTRESRSLYAKVVHDRPAVK